jgi:hypothetical protein
LINNNYKKEGYILEVKTMLTEANDKYNYKLAYKRCKELITSYPNEIYFYYVLGCATFGIGIIFIIN